MKRSLPVMLTVEDLESLPDDGNRYEIVDGELFVSTSPAFIHQKVLLALAIALAEYLRDHPRGDLVPGVGVIFDRHNAVIPDLLYVSNERLAQALADGRFVEAPDIAIEILSPGSANERRDRHVKLNLYSERGVKEYWIVDPKTRRLDVYRNGAGGLALASRFSPGDSIASAELPGFGAPVDRIFA